MNKLSLALTLMVAPLAGEAGAAASDPFGPQPVPLFEKRAASALLFDAADRQAAFVDSLRSDGAQRYAAFAGASRLYFGALPENMNLLDPLGPMLSAYSRRILSSAEFEKKMGRAIGILTIGVLRETGSAPAMQHSLAMALATRPTTTFTSLSLGYMLSPRSSLMAMASYGKTDGIGTPDSLLAQVSSVRTAAFSAGYARRELFTSNDRLAVTLSVPAKVRAGSLQDSALTAPAYGAPTLNLRPTATERDLEFGYSQMYGKQGKLTGAVMLRVNPGHDANARPDWLTGVRYSYGF